MTFDILRDLPKIPVAILRALILGREASAELAHINASTQRWLDEQPVTAAQPDGLCRGCRCAPPFHTTACPVDNPELAAQPDTEQRAKDERLRLMLAGDDPVLRAWAADSRRADAEIKQLRADVVRLTSERDALDDEALESATKIERLRENVAQLHTQKQGGPVAGQWVTLRLEDGTKVTGEFVRDVWGRGFVNGWLADLDGRSWALAPGGGGNRA